MPLPSRLITLPKAALDQFKLIHYDQRRILPARPRLAIDAVPQSCVSLVSRRLRQRLTPFGYSVLFANIAQRLLPEAQQANTALQKSMPLQKTPRRRATGRAGYHQRVRNFHAASRHQPRAELPPANRERVIPPDTMPHPPTIQQHRCAVLLHDLKARLPQTARLRLCAIENFGAILRRE